MARPQRTLRRSHEQPLCSFQRHASLSIYHLFTVSLTEVRPKSSWMLPNKSGEETSTERLIREVRKRTVTVKALKLKTLIQYVSYTSVKNSIKHSDFKNSFWGGIKWIPCQQHPKTINKVKLINQTGTKLKGKQKTKRQAIQGKTKKHVLKKISTYREKRWQNSLYL